MPSRKQRHLALILTPILGVAIALGVTPAGASDAPAAPRAGSAYVAVIDAGSSGTRLTLYAPGSDLTASRVFRVPLTTPGLSSFVDNPGDAGPQSVTPLIDALRDQLVTTGIPPADVPIALLATAGMRLLQQTNPAAVRAIFASTQTAITASGMPLRANAILPDVREAALAWVDANALSGTLDDTAPRVGIIEVGGASAQVAFHSPRPQGPGVIRVRVDGRVLHTVAVSYLGLGSNETRGAMQKKLDGGKPCFPNNATGVDPEFYMAASQRPVASDLAEFRGSPCGRTSAAVIGDVATTVAEPRIRPQRLGSLPGFNRASFVGLGSVTFTYTDFKIPTTADPRQALATRVRTTCKGPDAWASVRALYSEPVPSVADTLCSSGSYIGEFLFGSRGLDVDPTRINPIPAFAGGVPSWPSGYAITVLFP